MSARQLRLHRGDDDFLCAREAAVGELAGRLDVEELRRAVPFEQSVLMTADGKSVKERRHTAWLADEGIGALAYSGKLMAPASLAGSPSVAQRRDAR